jgi:hypothetical protein
MVQNAVGLVEADPRDLTRAPRSGGLLTQPRQMATDCEPSIGPTAGRAMGASAVTLQTQRRPDMSPASSSGASPWRRLAGGLVGCLLVSVLASCEGDRSDAAPLPTLTPALSPSSTGLSASPAPSPSATPESPQEMVRAQYLRFWTQLALTSRQPAARRRDMLEDVAVDPQLKSVLAGMARLERDNQILYGENRPRPSIRVAPDGLTAVVDDCQDSSGAGTADRRTGRRLTAGTPRNHVVVTMKRSPDGVWRMAFASYTKTPC